MENKKIDTSRINIERDFIREPDHDRAIKQAMFDIRVDIYIKQYEEKMKKKQEKKNV
jgi:hypothetical protein